MIDQEEYARRLEQRLKKWEDALAALKARTAQSSAEVKQAFDEQRAHFETLRQDTLHALATVRQKSEGAWQEARDKTEMAWEKLADQFEKITSKFGHH